MPDSLPKAREVQLGHDGRLYELDGTPLNVPGLGDEAARQSLTDARVRQGMTPPAAAGAGFVSPPVVACEDVDLESVERDALTHYYVSGGTVLGLVAMCRGRGAEVERLRAAVQLHYNQRGDSKCWQDDLKLYHDVLGINPDPYVTALPPDPDMEESCRRYRRQRQCPSVAGTYPMPGGMTIAQLTAEVERLKGLLGDGPSDPAPSWPDRLRFDHDVSGSSPVVVGTRVTAAEVADMIVNGYTWESILRFHPELTEADIWACLAYTVEHEHEDEGATPGPSPGAKADWVVTVRRTVLEKLHCPDCTRKEAEDDPIGRSSRTEEVEGSETVEVLGVARETEGDS